MIPIPEPQLGVYEWRFLDRVNPLDPRYPVTSKSPWPSELFALAALGWHHKVEHWIESGTSWGGSAYGLACCFESVVTIESDPQLWAEAVSRFASQNPPKIFFSANQPFTRVKSRGVVECVLGNGMLEVIDQVRLASGSWPIGIFLDGPKSWDAVALARVLTRWPRVAFVAIHDMWTSTVEVPNPARAALDVMGGWASDDAEFVNRFRYFDGDRHAEHMIQEDMSGWLPFKKVYRTGSPQWEMPSYGPTVGVLFR